MYKRAEYQVITSRLKEPRKFIQVVMGPLQVGKSTVVKQVLLGSMMRVVCCADIRNIVSIVFKMKLYRLLFILLIFVSITSFRNDSFADKFSSDSALGVLNIGANISKQFFSKMAYQPTCLHDFAIQRRWLSRFLLFQAYTKPTRCLHQPTRF